MPVTSTRRTLHHMDPPDNPISHSANADSGDGTIQAKQRSDVLFDQSSTEPVAADVVRTPLASSVVDLIFDHTSPEDTEQDAETLTNHNKAVWDATRTQLQDPKAPLTDEVLAFLLKVIHQTSDAPKVIVMDPLWLNLEDDHIPVDLNRIWESDSTVYVPLHHVEGKTKHWTLVKFPPHRLWIWHYDSMQSYDRNTRTRTLLARKLGESRPFTLCTHSAPQQTDGTSCGVHVAACLNYLLNNKPLPYSFDKTIRSDFLVRLEKAGIDPCSPRPNRYNRNKPIVHRSPDLPFTLERSFGTPPPKSPAASSPTPTNKLADIDFKQPKFPRATKNLEKSDPIGASWFKSPSSTDFPQHVRQDAGNPNPRQTTLKRNAQMDTWSRSNGGIDLSTAIAETEQMLHERQTQANRAVKRRRLFETLQQAGKVIEEVGLIPFGKKGSIWSSKVEEDAWMLPLEAMSNLVRVQMQRFTVDATESKNIRNEVISIETNLRKTKEQNKKAKAAKLMQEACKVMHEPES
ncbi:hypothetical protein NW768_008094 [Fusarium equiseti]|uniref:Ubiquitin-like protease family profile domain-containing protein n=1 Tax=Fusarium equiseti TaxID=61235 RepID=A0ABQ8R5S7_FUSEQ|nr:hypothetical protein NW768_008094 [Fusarium equiseti]